MKRIAVLTGGGDAPGLNAVIRAVVKTAINDYGCEVVGVRDSYDGFLMPGGVIPLSHVDVRGILPRGGTILGTASRGNPYSRKVIRDGVEEFIDVSADIIQAIKDQKLDALIVIGGDGTLHFAHDMFERGVPIVGVPKTIDNDIDGTEVTFGFDTAMNIATEAIDRLHTTAEAHQRAMVVELMGRDAGFITLHSGIAGGADVILIPEIPFKWDAVARKVMERKNSGGLFSIIAVSEGAKPSEGGQSYNRAGDEMYVPRLGGIGQKVGEYLEKATGVETRVTVLGHVQRGGTPSAFDRYLATRLGSAAVRVAAEGRFDRMVALNNGNIIDIPLTEAIAVPKRVDVNGDAVLTARGAGISFGDD
jgi:ATP-dependent phosphofructokinase / diphosphate-dependent phosphofructokinase